jgi:hypothetical protein
MALSRWESGTHEPTSRAYLQMGNLAQGKESIWFWTRAGMNTADLSRMFPEGSRELETAVTRVIGYLDLVPIHTISTYFRQLESTVTLTLPQGLPLKWRRYG